MVIAWPGSSRKSAIACCHASPSSETIAMRRGLSSTNMRQKSSHASCAALAVDVGMLQK
jgi:hypothetical protein